MRRRFIILCMLFSSSLYSFCQNQIVGKWLSDDKEGITEIYKQNGKYYGKITWLNKPNDDKDHPFNDTENPNKLLREQPLIGLVILKDFNYGDNEWKEGTIYDPESGKTYTCTIWLSGNNIIKVRGYWDIFYETQTWTKTK
jgi:uncharacterized protein (DUF2147 family)